MADPSADSESYLAVLKASYDYTPQSDDEIAIKEDQLLLLIERTDDEWWRVKVKSDSQDTESAVGLVPAAYVEQAENSSLVKALYDYEAAAPGELTVREGDVLHVFDTEEDWMLVQSQAAEGGAGYVPGNYVEVATDDDPPPVTNRIVVPDSPPRPVSTYVDPADRVASSKVTADDIKTWSVSEVDKKGKKKKGTLGVGNGAVFFASESDKTPVQKWQTADVTDVSIEKSKHVHLDISGSNATSLHFHAGSKDNAEEIVAKLHSSKAFSASSPKSSSEVAARRLPPAGTSSKKASVHFSAASPVIIPAREQEEEEEQEEQEPEAHEYTTQAHDDQDERAVALYDFSADGDDELSVAEGEHLVVLERDSDEWWKCRNATGAEGVVPASYIELAAGDSAGSAPAAAHVSLEDDAAEELRLTQEAADREEAEKRRREEEERARKKQEAQRRAKDAAVAAEAERKKRHEAAAAAAARMSPPPKVKSPTEAKKPTENGTHANSSPPKGSSDLGRPPPEKTRVWHDRSGQFRVEAAFLGFSNGKLRLHKVNGVVVEVPAEKMSIEDMRHVESAMSKKQRAPNGTRISEDDIPLAITRMNASSASSNATANGGPVPKKVPKIDWFDFFLSAGCDLDDCTRYATSFEKDKMDETLLPDITDSTMRSLGLREGDIIRVKKAIEKRKPVDNLIKPSPYLQEQLRRDEELARQLQAQESGGRNATPNLLAGPGGVLKGTRRGRPQPSKSLPLSNVDIKGITSASENIQRSSSPQVSTPSSAQPSSLQVPARSSSATIAPTNGFEDDAWTNRPSSTKPLVGTPPSGTPRTPSAPPVTASSTAPAPTPTATAPAPQPAQAATSNSVATTSQTAPSLAKTTESDIFEQLARLSQLRKPASPPQQLPLPAVSQSPFASPPPPGYPAGMVMGHSPVPMGQIQTQTPIMQQTTPQPYNGPRGPFAPVPVNQTLLQPLIPTQTAFTSFVPTRPPDSSQFQNQGQLSPSMFLHPSNNLSVGQHVLPQQTGIPLNNGFGSQIPYQNTGFGQVQSHITGFTPGMNSSPFGGLAASIPPVPPLPSLNNNNNNNNTSPANVFAQMKSGTFAVENENSASQSAGTYDALRPNPPLQMQATGWGQPYQQFMGYQR